MVSAFGICQGTSVIPTLSSLLHFNHQILLGKLVHTLMACMHLYFVSFVNLTVKLQLGKLDKLAASAPRP
jgi:hypothetical protein